jgi:hypothetical protein
VAHAFISYLREDLEQVDRLGKDLTLLGIKVWLDRNAIKPGMYWREAIREAITGGDFFIACFSSAFQARSKNFMNEELLLAIEELRLYSPNRPWFIPVLLSECEVPARSIGGGKTLLDIQWLALYEDWMGGVNKIAALIQPIAPEIQLRIDALLSDNDNIRLAAARALGEAEHSSAVHALVRALGDASSEVRCAAARALLAHRNPGIDCIVRFLTASSNIDNSSLFGILVKEVAERESREAAIVLHQAFDIGHPETRVQILHCILKEGSVLRRTIDLEFGVFAGSHGQVGDVPHREIRAIESIRSLTGLLLERDLQLLPEVREVAREVGEILKWGGSMAYRTANPAPAPDG